MYAHFGDACRQAARVQGIKQIMLDIEGPTWNFTQSENRDYVSALRSAVEQGGCERNLDRFRPASAHKHAIYTHIFWTISRQRL